MVGLPSELWQKVFLYLDQQDLPNVAIVSREFTNVLRSKHFLRQLFEYKSIVFTCKLFEARKEDIKEILTDMVPEINSKPWQLDLNDPRRFYFKGTARGKRDLNEYTFYLGKYLQYWFSKF